MKRKIIIIMLAIIYLYASYELKIVRDYNQNYHNLGMADSEVILGGLLLIAFIIRKQYVLFKYTKLLKTKR
ncbi:hypothetical protein R2F61_02620 [Mollicutes bacterium LVI A0078]|nr:hypothetical protein RZE84_02650 [Mollicutes bacterium LVI A0075]WOO91464.1 hypothetical protein R2F61_02620 [Mollicutes bacterium LVI A0078]